MNERRTEAPIMRAIHWVWVIGGALMTAIGALLLVMFVRDGASVLIALIAGIIFAVIGPIAGILGIKGVIRQGRR